MGGVRYIHLEFGDCLPCSLNDSNALVSEDHILMYMMQVCATYLWSRLVPLQYILESRSSITDSTMCDSQSHFVGLNAVLPLRVCAMILPSFEPFKTVTIEGKGFPTSEVMLAA
jgi:hypothetical protein